MAGRGSGVPGSSCRLPGRRRHRGGGEDRRPGLWLARTCPHQGAALAEAILDGRRLICPWHHVTFDLTTGGELEYESLLLATRSQPRRLPAPALERGNVFTLRSQSDCDRIAAGAAAGTPAVVVG